MLYKTEFSCRLDYGNWGLYKFSFSQQKSKWPADFRSWNWCMVVATPSLERKTKKDKEFVFFCVVCGHLTLLLQTLSAILWLLGVIWMVCQTSMHGKLTTMRMGRDPVMYLCMSSKCTGMEESLNTVDGHRKFSCSKNGSALHACLGVSVCVCVCVCVCLLWFILQNEFAILYSGKMPHL